MTELVNGMKVTVSDNSVERAATNTATIYHYVGQIDDGRHIVEDTNNGQIIRWKYCVPVPEPVLIPWTFETSPDLPIVVRNVKTLRRYQNVILYKDDRYLTALNGEVSHGALLSAYEYLSEGKWLPCGVMADETT